METRQPLHEFLRQHAREQPDKAACLWYGRPVPYAELDRASDAFAARLAQLGVGKGAPVVLFMNNCPQYLMAHYGIQKRGAIVCPCSPLFKQHELQYQLADLQARAIVIADDLLPVLDQVRSQTAVEHVFVVRHADLLPEAPTVDVLPELLAMKRATRAIPSGCEDFLAVTRSGAAAPPVTIDMDDVALMTYTSGTTGLPKGAMLTYGNALFKSAAAADGSGLQSSDVLMAVAPLYHIAGMVAGVNVPVLKGATSVLFYRFDPVATLQAIERHRVTSWYSIAPMNVACMQVPGAKEYDLSSLRINSVTSFGITFTESLAMQWREHAPNCQSFESGYGLSETHTVDTCMPPHAIRWGTNGIPIPGNELRILDPDTGSAVPTGQQGEIVLRSAGVFKGYWNNAEGTARTLRNGWVHTGDMGFLDADGYLTFTGRIKEMIKVSGYPVFPEQVEGILVKHPAVAQAAVIGVPDATKGEVVRAFIVRKPGQEIDADSLMAWARDNMSAYKVPRELRFVDQLPTTGAGKVLRRLLRDVG